MDNASLLGGARTVDALEPATHELGEREVLRGVRQEGVRDIVGQGLQLIRWKDVRECRAVGYSLCDGA